MLAPSLGRPQLRFGREGFPRVQILENRSASAKPLRETPPPCDHLQDGRDEDLARLTPPFHFVPNPREIEGWHLLEGPSACEERELRGGNAPGELREFIFSPEVGRSVVGADSTRSVEARDVEEVERFGRGSLTIERFALQSSADGCPGIAWMDFSVRLEGGY